MKKIDDLEKYCDDCKTLLKSEKDLNALVQKLQKMP